MYGLRNPWRFSFDSKNGDMWIGDVGQDKFEEVDYARAGTGAGANWGWNLREGFHPYNGGARPPGARDPILERPHTAGDCAIIGGYVYRGSSERSVGRRVRVRRRVHRRDPRGDAERRPGHADAAPCTSTSPSSRRSVRDPKGALFAASRTGTIYRIAS